MKTIVINCGHSALANGAIYPINKMVDLAAVLNVKVDYGNYYGDDRITVSDEHVPIAIELLNESKLLYQIEGEDDSKHWCGVIEGSQYDRTLKNILAHSKRDT